MENPPAINEEDIMAVAAAMSREERLAYLKVACGEHVTVREKIEKRLSKGSASPLDKAISPALALSALEVAQMKPEEAGDRLGRYKLLQQIGEGGFGTVWVAEQESPVKRRVALKIIKLGMDTKQVIARFEQERQALALMDHPNVAKVFDAGATQFGRPYFVMELVRGIKITEYCNQSRLTTVERLQLFITLCRAVQHAHQKGIIHRDLKPSNLLVALHDGEPVPKIIDFGVAKAMQQQGLTDLTIYTQMEQMMGTPAYMSPEQADSTGLDIDTRSDIYSLGVLLYELLTGQIPFDPRDYSEGGMELLRRVLREQEPQRPSAVLTTMEPEERMLVAMQRRADELELIGELRGDLDWIVMKALEKDRARRYDTANDLAADIQRYLSDQPVLARPPSQLYRFRRFTRRHKTGVLSCASIAAALVIGSTVSVWQAIRANREADRANHALAELRNMAPSLVAEARELVLAGKFKDAISKLGHAIQLRPDSVSYLRERAALLRSQLRLPDAAEDYRRILALQPSDARAQANLVLCERLDAGPREPGGKLPRTALAELHAAMMAEARPAAELMPLAEALGQANEILRRYWLDRLRAFPNASDKPLSARLKAGDGGFLELDLSGTKVADVSLLNGMPLRSLNLNGCSNLKSIEALRGMPLRKLDLTGTGVASLVPLEGSQTLEELVLTGVAVADLSPLRGLPLRILRLARTDVSNVSALQGMQLSHLELGHTRVSDLRPLANVPLRMLECSYTPVADYSPLAATPLEHLALQGNRVGDLAFLRAVPLKSLVLTDARDVSNIRVLKEVKTLEVLVLPGNPLALDLSEIEAIEALKAHPNLQRISCTLPAGSVADSAEAAAVFWRNWDGMMQWWRPLRAAGIAMHTKRLPDQTWMVAVQGQPLHNVSVFANSTVSFLDIANCKDIVDLSPLRGVPLTTLSIAHTGVSDLSPLAGSGLRSLWMADTRVTNLSPLRGVPLKTLFMDKCFMLTDVSPLVDVPELEEVLLPETATNVLSLRSLPKLRRISYTFDLKMGRPVCAAPDFWKEYHELTWLRALRSAAVPLMHAQLPDGTWNLTLSDVGFADLHLLKGGRISELILNGTDVTDLQPLVGMPLRRLRLDGTPCTDVSPLARIPTLESVVLPPGAKNVASLRLLPALKRLSFQPDVKGEPALDAATFWKAPDQ